MTLETLGTDDLLRIRKKSDESLVASFFLLSGESIQKKVSAAKIDPIVPIYGDVFFVFDNPTGKKYNAGSIGLEGTKAAFEAVDALTDAGSVERFELVVGGDVLPLKILEEGLVASVTYTESVNRGVAWATGTVSFIKT